MGTLGVMHINSKSKFTYIVLFRWFSNVKKHLSQAVLLTQVVANICTIKPCVKQTKPNKTEK